LIGAIMLLGGCDAFRPGTTGIDGYWKGQIVEDAAKDQPRDSAMQENRRAIRVLMLLEEDDGVISGKFAQSSDVVAFGRLAGSGSRNISMHTVEGTRNGPEVHIRFPGDDGRNFDVKATLSAGKLSGTYSASPPAGSPSADVTEGGIFDVERY